MTGTPARRPAIRASNPCSEYMFLDDTACNLASLNLLHVPRRRERPVRHRIYEHAVRLWTIVLEISVMMAQFPSQEIAELSYEYRTLGLGYANIGGLLMASGIPYDSDAGRAICGAITAIMTGVSYATSAEMAGELGPFPGYAKNRDAHAARHAQPSPRRLRRSAPATKSSPSPPVPLDHAACADRGAESRPRQARLGQRARARRGTRLPQRAVTVIAPTGTIGLVMDCDTTGIEPDFALVKFKKLAGGGYFKIINRAVPEALRTLGYSESRDRRDRRLCRRPRRRWRRRPRINHTTLKAKGFTDEAIAKVEKALPDRLRHQVRLQQVDAGRRILPRDPRHLGRATSALADLRPARPRSASPSARSRPPTSTSAAP